MKIKRTFFERARRGVATLLVSAMMIPSVGGMTAYATELEVDGSMKENFGGLTTAYRWYNGRFDPEGIMDASLVNKVGAYTGDNARGVRTTYRSTQIDTFRAGYETVVGVGSAAGTAPTSTVTTLSSSTIAGNGGIANLTSLGLELQMKVYPSADQKWMLVDYILYNKSSSSQVAYVASGTDVQIGGITGSGSGDPADASALYLNERGFHMVNSATLQSFDCITNGDDPTGAVLGVTSVSGRWGGKYGSRTSNYWNNLPTSTHYPGSSGQGQGQAKDMNGQSYVSGVDSGLTYHWRIPLQPYETVTKRVAFAAKGPSYYVNSNPAYGHDNSTTTGAADDPFLTIGKALEKLGSNMGYIYIQEYNPITSTISVGSNVTIMSADYNTSNMPINDIITLEKAASLKDAPMFQTSGSGTIRFGDIELKGYQVSGETTSIGSILKAASGTIGIQSGTVITGNKVTDTNVGSAIDITGTADLEMNYGEITGNISAGAGAVNFNSNGTFKVQNAVLVRNNTLKDGTTHANVYLPDNKIIRVIGELEGAQIGITTQSMPESSDSIVTPTAAQLITLAPYITGGATISDPGLYADQFEADVTGLSLRITSNGKDIVLRRDGLEMNLDFQNQSGGSIQPSVLKHFATGETVNIPVTAPLGYQFIEVKIEPATQTTLTADTSGNITGTMPGTPIVVTYVYQQVGSSIAFITNGGTPQPATLLGSATTMISGALPVVSRYGYEFRGWYEDSGFTISVTSLPSVYPATPLTYYAKWAVDNSVTFDYVVQYVNAAGNITFQRSLPSGYPIDTVLHSEKKVVPGYALSSASVSPSTISPVSPAITVFNGIDDFDALMPNEQATVTYRYGVDYGQSPQNLTVRHVSAAGAQVHAPSVTGYYPEGVMSAVPESIYGYDLTSWSVTAGDTADPTNFLSAVNGSFDSGGGYNGTMPNQSVEITYVYTYNGSGYEYIIENKDTVNGADLEAANVAPKSPGDLLTAAPGTFYGYDSAGITWGDNPATGAFTSGGSYSATMPNDSLTVSYTYNRDASKWRTVTYKPGLNGTLGAGTTTSDVIAGTVTGTYETPILVTDGTVAGDTGCYNWQQLGNRNLIPTASANQYYLFGGWFIDTNGNGIKDGTETYLTASDVFSTAGSNITVTADFMEDPAWWIDIYFEAGARGNISGNSTYHTTKDRTWGSIPTANLPAGIPQVNYLIGGWYLGNSVMQGSELLLNAKTYTLKFALDPNIFGTALQAPDAAGNVDLDGSGMITVYGTTGGYQYVVTDLAGNIAAAQIGSDLSSSLIFHDLYPGSRYHVYEVSLLETITLGSPISDVAAGNRSASTEVLIPVVENNVSVLYDEDEESKVKIVIDPADPDVSYALIDKNGDVVMTNGSNAKGWVKPSGSHPTVEWGGLNANEEYTIVAIQNNKTNTNPLDKLLDGSTITADPTGEIDIPYFSIETINGTILSCGGDGVGNGYYDQAEAGDNVIIRADAVNGAGQNFLYWKVVVGGGFNGKVRNREFAFTMPSTNVVLCAYYERPTATPSNASVAEEVRGGSEHEIALDPNEYQALENTLTTAADRDLMDINGAKVTYKIVFNKNKVKTSELTIVEGVSSVYDDHPSAFTGAWGLDVFIERYINGRKAGVASPSNATFDVIIQLDNEDVDMMDYELYELYDNGSGGTAATLVSMSDDPEDSGGLFRFTAEANCRYVLVYSKAFKVTVLNEVMPPPYYYRFKVRKGEAISDTAYYQTNYDEMRNMDSYWQSIFDWIDVDGIAHTWTDNDGVWHDYKGFSTNKLTSRFKEYDYDTVIKKATTIYAFYGNNREELMGKRVELEQAINDVIKLSEDYFLTIAETDELRELIRQALEILNQMNRRANFDELNEALRNLLFEQQPQQEISEERHSDYGDMHSSSGSSSKGGGGGGGGTGSGTKTVPYIPVKGNTYTVGVNGSWEQLSNGQWAFALTGGTHLRSMWAWLVYSDGGVDKTGWYHFSHAGIMNDSWFRDEAFNWYYCETVHDGGFGRMKTGWHLDSTDQYWYYMDPESGMMATGWYEIGGEWYYFAEYNNGPAYTYDTTAERWHYTNVTERPFGSLYTSAITPDGYQVNERGAWSR